MLLKPLLIASLIVALIASAALAAYFVINFNIKVNVPTNKEFNIDLIINNSSGSKYLPNLTTLDINSPTLVRFTAKVIGIEGNFSVSISGSATFKSSGRNYRVIMPCMITLGSAKCFRIMSLIPGWDSPLTIAPGNYRVSLKISWKDASGKGYLRLRLKLLNLGSPEKECGSPSIKAVGTKPSSTDGWVKAEGSTKSYAMLTSEPLKEGACCSLNAWVWFFNPLTNTQPSEVTIYINDSAGHLIKQKSIPLRNTGTYSEVLLMINLPSGRNYLITASLGSINLTTEVKCS